VNTFLERLFNLNGKVVAITGGGGHICSELAAGFAEAGCAVAVLDLRVEKAQKVAKGLKRQGFDKVLAHAFDVSEKQGHIDALNTVLDCFGRVDVLINGAGINSATPILKITADLSHSPRERREAKEWFRICKSLIYKGVVSVIVTSVHGAYTAPNRGCATGP